MLRKCRELTGQLAVLNRGSHVELGADPLSLSRDPHILIDVFTKLHIHLLESLRQVFELILCMDIRLIYMILVQILSEILGSRSEFLDRYNDLLLNIVVIDQDIYDHQQQYDDHYSDYHVPDRIIDILDREVDKNKRNRIAVTVIYGRCGSSNPSEFRIVCKFEDLGLGAVESSLHPLSSAGSIFGRKSDRLFSREAVRP